MKIKGSGTYTDKNGRNHSVLGVGEVADDEKLQKLEVIGNLSFEKISCNKISISGKCLGGSISTQSLKIFGACEGDSVIAKNFSASGKVEFDSLTIEQNLEITGKPSLDSVTANEIVIASRNGFLGKVKCCKIKIYDNAEKINREVFGKIFIERFAISQSWSHVRIKNIEADIVELENCEVDVIKCKDAFIGSNCAIKKLLVAGKCEVAADSTIGETIKT